MRGRRVNLELRIKPGGSCQPWCTGFRATASQRASEAEMPMMICSKACCCGAVARRRTGKQHCTEEQPRGHEVEAVGEGHPILLEGLNGFATSTEGWYGINL